MGRAKKYPDDDPYAGQKAYLKSEKGKVALKKYQTSDRCLEKKRNWWRDNRSPKPSDRVKKFINKYGDVEKALSLLDEREQEVIVKIHGLDGNLPIKQKEIAKQWGTSQQWITEVKQKAIAKLEKVTKSKHEAIDPEQEENPSPQ